MCAAIIYREKKLRATVNPLYIGAKVESRVETTKISGS